MADEPVPTLEEVLEDLIQHALMGGHPAGAACIKWVEARQAARAAAAAPADPVP
jgi:hypothetical protein